jgi:hypothetical protein
MLEIEVALAVTTTFDALGVPYCVGGSFASIVHGEARATRDVDILAALRPAHIPMFVATLSPTFSFQPEDVQVAVGLAPTLCDTPQQRATFNMIHQASFFKADIFVSSGRPFDTSQFARRVLIEVSPGQSLAIASAEDTVLAKLEWYRMGGEISDRQWRDVLAVLAAQSDRLDDRYLRQWAAMLGVRDLLDRALGDDPPLNTVVQQQLF